MYTSGTTGDPKGVMMSNESILALVAGVDRHLECTNEKANFPYCTYFFGLLIAIHDVSFLQLTPNKIRFVCNFACNTQPLGYLL